MEVGQFYEYTGDTINVPKDKAFPVWLTKGRFYEMVENGVFIDGNGNKLRVPLNEFRNRNKTMVKIVLLDKEEKKLSDGYWHVVFSYNKNKCGYIASKRFILREDAKKYYSKFLNCRNVNN